MLKYVVLILSVGALALTFMLIFGLGSDERPLGCTGGCPDACTMGANCICACPGGR